MSTHWVPAYIAESQMHISIFLHLRWYVKSNKCNKLPDPLLTEIRERMFWTELHFISILSYFPSFPLLQILIYFKLAKVSSHAREKYWFQRLDCKQSWRHGLFIEGAPFVELRLTRDFTKMFQTLGIIEMHPMCYWFAKEKKCRSGICSCIIW